MENKTFDWPLARAHTMNYGALVGIMCSISFLCSMYGLQSPSLGLISNVLALLAFIVAGRCIRSFSNNIPPTRFGQACWMAFNIFLYAILITALVQFLYFTYLDQGRLATQMQHITAMPEYRQLLEQMAPNGNADEIIKTAISITSSPARATSQLLWMNCFMALLLIIPTALIGITGKKQQR